MKGIVAEINGKYAIILTQSGMFKKVKAEKHMTVGCEINMNQPTDNLNGTRYISKVVSIAAAALLVMGVGFGAYSYTIPYSYVDLDINPSIEITTNIYDRIIGIEALNEDGKKLLHESKLKNARLESGISQLISIATEQGYLKAYSGSLNDEDDATGIMQETGGTTPAAAGITNSSITVDGNTATSGSTTMTAGISAQKVADPENAVLLTVASKNGSKSESLKKEIVAAVSKELDKSSVNSKVLIGKASVKQREDARKLGVTPGKLALIEDALESEPELKLEKLKEEAVKDLINRAKQKKTAESEKKTAKEEKKNTDAQKEQKAADVKEQKPLVDPETKNIPGKWTDHDQLVQRNKNDNDNMGGKTIKSDEPDKGRTNDNNSTNGKSSADDKSRTDAGDSINNRNNLKDKNSTKDESKTQNKNNSNDRNNQSNSNMGNFKQEIADTLNREKQERQKLKDELLEQINKVNWLDRSWSDEAADGQTNNMNGNPDKNSKSIKNNKDNKDDKGSKDRTQNDEKDDKGILQNQKNRTGVSDKNITGGKNKDTGKWNGFGGKK